MASEHPDNVALPLKEQGNALFKAGNFLKAAAVYTQAIRADPCNATLYSNRSAAFLSLSKVTKALADAETTVKLRPTWEKGYFRKGCALEAMGRYEEAITVYRQALEQNPQSGEVATKIKRLSQMVREKKRAQDKQTGNSSFEKNGTILEQLKSELVHKTNSEVVGEEIHNFAKEVLDSSMKDWNDNDAKVDGRVYFYSGIKKDPSVVTVDKAFESPDTLSSCVSFLRQYAVDTSSKAAVLIVSKRSIAFPQVWKGQGTRRWKHSQADGFFMQLDLSSMRKLWFVPCAMEKGRPVCRDLEQLDIDVHAILPPLFR
eukprot:c26523_g1_i1 orf=190-1134(+)